MSLFHQPELLPERVRREMEATLSVYVALNGRTVLVDAPLDATAERLVHLAAPRMAADARSSTVSLGAVPLSGHARVDALSPAAGASSRGPRP